MKLFYRKYGNGPPLLILHGLYGSSDNWVSIAKELSSSFTVYLPDLRNHGQSPHDDLLDYESMRDDLFELACDLSLKKFFLAGHSMGGKTAICFALRWPELISGLLIVDISPFRNESNEGGVLEHHLKILNAILNTDTTKIHTRREAENQLKKQISSEKERSLILKNLQRTDISSFSWKLNASSILRNLDRLMSGINTDFKQQISGFPVTFLKGDKSNYIQEKDFKEIIKLFPSAEIINVPGAGHWLQVDNPGEVIKNIKNLLTD